MQASNEFAEPYSRAERLRFIVFGTMGGALAVLAGRLWLFPALRAFAAVAPCRTVLGLPGEVVLGYGVFVGFPLLASCIVALTVGRRGLRILRDGQVPPLGEKVLRPTRIIRGRRAIASGYLHAFAAVPLVVIVLWGVVSAPEWSRHTGKRSMAQCVAGPQGIRNDREGSASSPDAAR